MQAAVPAAASGVNSYPPGMVQPPAYQAQPPVGFNNQPYRPPMMQPVPLMPPTSGKHPSSNVKATNKSSKSNYRPATGSAAASKTKAVGSSKSSLESRVGKLESNDHRQDLRLGRLERDVGLLPNSIEGGGVADIVSAGKTHTVRPGDTLFSVASRYNTSVGELRSLNRMTGDTLDIGETLLIPDATGWGDKSSLPSVAHIVSGEETLSDLARDYGVTEDAIARANPTVYPSDLRRGERIMIPNPRRMPAQAAALRGGGTSAETSTLVHRVKKGEMLGRIASKYGVSLSKLMAANGMKNPHKIMVGQQLVIPGKKVAAPQPVKVEVETTPLPHHQLAEVDPQPSTPSVQAPVAPVQPTTPPSPPLVAEPEPLTQRGIVSYRVQRGDTLQTIAAHFSTTEANIRAINKFSADRVVKEREEIFVPTVGAVSVN